MYFYVLSRTVCRLCNDYNVMQSFKHTIKTVDLTKFLKCFNVVLLLGALLSDSLFFHVFLSTITGSF